MLNAIFLGLSALSSITGFASGINYNTTTEDLDNVSRFICKKKSIEICEFNKLDKIYFNDLYTISGENRYIEIAFDNGYVIYDKKTDSIDEYSFSNQSPYVNYKDYFKIYSEETLDFKYSVYSNNDFINLGNNISVNFSEIMSSYADSVTKKGEYYRDIMIPNDAKVISNAYYFENLNGMHAWNSKGTCSIVSLEILLGYYDTFENDLIVPEIYDVTSSENTGTNLKLESFVQSPGVDDHNNDDHDFHDYLCTIGKQEVNDDPEVDGMNTANQIELLEKYLDKQNLNYDLLTSSGTLGNIWTEKAVSSIKNGIDNNRPVISNGSGHSTVAFAYNDEYVWVHTGWGWIGATPWSTYESGLFSNYSAGCIDISNIEKHIHSDNYYSYNNNIYICPCGQHYSSTTITPENWGFDARYYFENEGIKSKQIQQNGLTINTNRLRCGFIENEYINLSPKRQGAGEAYIEMYFDESVRKFEINLSYWQSLDKLSSLDSTAYLEVLNTENKWVRATDLINDVNLSTDRTHQETYSYNYVGNEIWGIRITMTSPATGSRNLGRISLGNLTMIHTV